MSLEFTLPGDLKSKERPRLGRGGRTFTPKATLEAEAAIRDCIREHLPHGWTPLDGRVRVTVTAYLSTNRRADLDNKVKTLLDALNPAPGWCGIWHDDSQVDEIHAIAVRGVGKREARAEVVITEL